MDVEPRGYLYILRACIFIEKTDYKLYPRSSSPNCSRGSSIIQNKLPYASDLNPDLNLYPQELIACNRYKKGLLHLLISSSFTALLWTPILNVFGKYNSETGFRNVLVKTRVFWLC